MEIIVIFSLIASIFMGVSIGASSVAPSFAPVNSSGGSSVMRLALISGVFAFLGSVLQGQNVASTVGSGILMGSISTLQAAIILFVGSVLVIASVLTDYPMPTAFTVVGAVVGSGLGFGTAVNTGELGMVFGFWFATPFAAAALSYITARLLRKYVPKEGSERKINALLLISGSYVAYTAGAASVGLAVGPLQGLEFSTSQLLLLGGGAILLGSWLISPRIIKAVAYDYSNVGPRRSVAALASSGILAQAGIFIGAPVSFNLAIVASMIGSGLVKGRTNMESQKIRYTVAAWVGAFMLAVALSYGFSVVAASIL
jgi:phosphate/sulfate permease